MYRPITQAGLSRPPPAAKQSQSAAAPPKKGLSQGAFAKMALFHSEETDELRPIRRKLPTRAGNWSDDDVCPHNSLSHLISMFEPFPSLAIYFSFLVYRQESSM
jgi:hypothetical protein